MYSGKKLVVLIGLALIAAAAVACGGTSSPPTSTATTVADTPEPTAPPSPTPVPTQSPTPVSTPPGNGAGTPDDLVARGKVIYEETAGGVGCALCHGFDAQGKPEVGAPPNIGVTEADIAAALQDRAQMTFIKMTDDEIKAVAAYLKFLAEQP